MFFKKKTALDEDTILLAGIKAGMIFRAQEAKFGRTPLEQINPIMQHCISSVCKQLSVNPDSQSHQVIHAVSTTFAMDESGLARRLTQQFEKGMESISREDAQKVWDLSLSNAEGFAKFAAEVKKATRD